MESVQNRHGQSPARGPNAALDQILTGPHGSIQRMDRTRHAASIVVKCGPTDIHLTTCGPHGKNLDTPGPKHTKMLLYICILTKPYSFGACQFG